MATKPTLNVTEEELIFCRSVTRNIFDDTPPESPASPVRPSFNLGEPRDSSLKVTIDESSGNEPCATSEEPPASPMLQSFGIFADMEPTVDYSLDTLAFMNNLNSTVSPMLELFDMSAGLGFDCLFPARTTEPTAIWAYTVSKRKAGKQKNGKQKNAKLRVQVMETRFIRKLQGCKDEAVRPAVRPAVIQNEAKGNGDRKHVERARDLKWWLEGMMENRKRKRCDSLEAEEIDDGRETKRRDIKATKESMIPGLTLV
ncbi:hypothetical protein K504DRAFT_449096 [Pleomassaria siparia CBS 279.74]|uniref:Uncharacterized protein n=1 Tax=Pleomassaria siparia CBS 279.74 TaxID=1314801 RepID=A0A6G1JXP8_9PLEO|nr:hypothetical protein K504DRAFT_449096 [Pleomassaria siparia CBS 279.74]